MIWKKFNALGTEIVITADLDESQSQKLFEAERIINKFEQQFSRFIEGNELDLLNAYSGDGFEASDMLIDMLQKAKSFYDITGGIFDPTIIGSLKNVGYDKPFDDIIKGYDDPGSAIDLEKIKRESEARARFTSLSIEGRKISKPEGLSIDLGGIGKGYIADHLANGLFGDTKNFWISAGGDLIVKGGDKEGEGWKVGVQNPNEPEKETFSIKNRGEKIGIATSGIFKRKGKHGGFDWHHLIDPRTGLPVSNDILAVTAVASDATRADVFAKTVLIAGEKEGLEFIESLDDAAAVIFFKDGRVSFSKKALKYF